MAHKLLKPTLDQVLEALRAHGFEATPEAGVAGGVRVSKYGVASVLKPGSKETPVALVLHPGVLVRGEIARLFDRGYQKFIKSFQFELPATAEQLHAIHMFSEELKLLSGEDSLYNESLGTTSDLYHYDRLKGRAAAEKPATRPWELADGH